MYDKEKEEEPLVHSSSFSNNEKLKIKSFSESEQAPQKITEVPTLATAFMNEPAKVYQKEEIRDEASETTTPCNDTKQLETQQHGKSIRLESQSLAEEKQLLQAHRNRESSSGLNVLQDIPLLAGLLSPSDENEKIQTDDSARDDLSQSYLKTSEKHKEIIPMKAQQIHLEPQRNMEFELSGAIFKSFGGARSDEIMDHCKFIPINGNKIGVQTSDGFTLAVKDKEQLKTCIRSVYGEAVNIVSSTVLKIVPPITLTELVPSIPVAQPFPSVPFQQHCDKWERFKNELLNFFPENAGHHILSAWFDKLRVSEDKPNNRIILSGSTFYVDSIYSRFETAIEHVVKKMGTSQNKVILELHYEDNSQKPIIYKP